MNCEICNAEINELKCLSNLCEIIKNGLKQDIARMKEEIQKDEKIILKCKQDKDLSKIFSNVINNSDIKTDIIIESKKGLIYKE